MGDLKSTIKIFEIPFSRNERFSGRREQLEKLRKNFILENIQCITGIGGIGKTQLAIEYAYLNSDKYNIVFWINAVDKSSIIDGYLKLANEIGFDVTKKSDEVIEGLFKWLSSENKWLIILDNVEDINLIDTVIPNFISGHYIITTKDPNKCKRIKESLILEEFSKNEANTFIKNNLSSENDDECDLLAYKLGFLPIALEQAVSYIDINSIDIKTYLTLYEKYNIKLLSRNMLLYDHNKSIFNTWNISIDRIRKKAPNAILIAKILCFLDSNNIARKLISKINFKEVLNITINELELIDAIGILKKYSIIRANSKYLSMHCIVQEFIMQYIDNEYNYNILEKLSREINDKLPLNLITVNEYKIYLDLINHCRRLLSQIINYNVINEDVVDLLVKASIYLRKDGEIEEALKYCLKAKDIQNNLKKYKSCTPAEVFNAIGGLYKEKLDFKNALIYYNKSLDELKSCEYSSDCSNEGITSIAVKNNMAVIDMKLGNYNEAKKKLKTCLEQLKALEINEEKLKVKISILSNLSLSEQELEEFDEALIASKEACKLSKQIYTENNVLYARELNNYATIMSSKGNNDYAITLYKKSIKIYTECIGKNNKELPTEYCNLAKCFIKIKDYKTARHFLSKAIEINRLFYGEDHYSFASIHEILGYISYENKEYEKCYIEFNTVKYIIEKNIGENRKLIETYKAMGLCQVKMGNLNEAKHDFQNSINVSKRLFNDSPHLHFNNVYDIAIELTDLKHFNLSIYYLNFCKKLLNTIKGDRKNQIYNTYLYLGGAYSNNKQYSKSIKCFCKCLKVVKETKDLNSIALIYSNLAAVYSMLDNIEKTFEYLRNAVKIDRENFLKKKISIIIKENVESITKLKYEKFLL